MYVTKESIVPNFHEMSELPFCRQDAYPLEANLTAQKLLQIRGLTHKHSMLLAKIFTFWPQAHKQSQEGEYDGTTDQMIINSQLPIMSAEDCKYFLNEMLKAKQIEKAEWSELIMKIDQFLQHSAAVIEQLYVSECQIKFKNGKDFLKHSIYYCPMDGQFRLKASFRSMFFEVSAFLGKKKISLNCQNGLIFSHPKIRERLALRLDEKLKILSKGDYPREKVQKLRKKWEDFYGRDLKQMDQQVLSLQLRFNFPLLRMKSFVPINFTDSFEEQPLVGPIFGNAHRNCMYGHFYGYNSKTCLFMKGKSCQQCGIEMREVKRNLLLEFLRDNVFNPCKQNILYCPQFNRFKLIHQYSEEEQVNQKLSSLKISQQSQMQQQASIELSNWPKLKVYYSNYMHILSTIKKMYPLTKKRLKFRPQKSTEVVKFVYRLQGKASHNHKKYEQYFGDFELSDPVRGKNCSHYEFADFREFYFGSFEKCNGFANELIFVCPICKIQMKDGELIYLKETEVLIKYLNMLMGPNEKNDYLIGTNEEESQKRAIRNSAKIIINNVEAKVFVEFNYEQNGSVGTMWKEVENFYPSLIDPYIHFSDYELGIRSSKKKSSLLLFMDNQAEQSDSEKLEKDWLSSSSTERML